MAVSSMAGDIELISDASRRICLTAEWHANVVNLDLVRKLLRGVVKVVSRIERVSSAFEASEFKEGVMTVYNCVCGVLTYNLRYLMSAPMRLRDEREITKCPAAVLWTCLDACLVFMQRHWALPLSHCYHKRVSMIPYCVKWGLVKTPYASPSTMTHQQLLLCLNALEDSQNMPYSQELVEYIEALELRLAELCSNEWDDTVLDNPRGRVEYDEGYVISDSADIELHTKLTCIMIWLRTGIPEMRRSSHCIKVATIDEEKVRCCMMAMTAQSDIITSEQIINEFSTLYTSKKVRMSEGVLFRTETGVDDVTYLSIIKKYRSKEECDNICASSKTPLSSIGRHPTLDHAAFVAWFNIIVDVLCLKHLEEPWIVHSFSNNELLRQKSDMLRMSRAYPIFVESHNEACIVYKSKLYVFGSHYKEWIQAFLSWIDLSKGVARRRFKIDALEMLEYELMNTLTSSQTRTTFNESSCLYQTLLSTISTMNTVEYENDKGSDEPGFMSGTASSSVWNDSSTKRRRT